MLTRRHLIPTLERHKLEDLAPGHIRKFRSNKLNKSRAIDENRSAPSRPLRKALQQAVNDGLLPRNVGQDVKVHQTRKAEVRYLDAEQAKRLLSSTRGDRLEALYVLAIYTGLRQGELLGLKWEDIDFDAGTLAVERTLCSAKEGSRFTTPKTRKSRRKVPLTVDAIAALERHRTIQDEEKAIAGDAWEDSDLVFRSTTGTPI